MTASLRERFLAKVEMLPDAPGCWLWTAALQFPTFPGSGGYGVIGVGRRAGGKQLAHRVAYELFRGPIPGGLVLDHLCRVRSCVNPSHLEAVNQRENALRGEGFSGRHGRKTTCPKGHPYDVTDTSVSGRPCRRCSTCRREQSRDRHRRRRQRLRDHSDEVAA